ncbi:ATP-dependent DNA helicase RecG, partial [Vibrio alfacsensis]
NLSMLAVRSKGQQDTAIGLAPVEKLKDQLLEQLPFSPTGAQSRVVQEIETDLAKPIPMMRLVQGDVGSGKTLVAALAAVRAIEH